MRRVEDVHRLPNGQRHFICHTGRVMYQRGKAGNDIAEVQQRDVNTSLAL